MRKFFMILALALGLAGCGVSPGGTLSQLDATQQHDPLPANWQDMVLANIIGSTLYSSSDDIVFSKPEPRERGWYGKAICQKQRMFRSTEVTVFEYIIKNGEIIEMEIQAGHSGLLQFLHNLKN